MRHKIHRLLTLALATVLVCSSIFQTEVLPISAAEAESSALPFRELTGPQLTEEMGAGWNLGNTFDGHTGFTPNETVWQNVKTTKELIKAVHDLGFNAIRIPVTWGTMIDDENGYAIDEAWISRVQDVVDYAIEQDMYVIINIHHDGAEQMGWLRIATTDKTNLIIKFKNVWKNIAERFKDYDEHLIFEAMNEVKGEAMTLAEENKVIMDLNQIFVDTVRATGSNNAKRWLVVCGKYNYIDSLVNTKGGFELPKDSIENRIMLSVHCYSPWLFCGTDNNNSTTYTLDQLQTTNERELAALEQFTSQGIPVMIGEYGCINKDNASERAFYLEGMNKIFRKYNLIGIYWDQGWYDRSQTPDYSFSIIDRETGLPIEKEVTDAILRGFYTRDDSTLADLVHDTQVTEITDIILPEETIELTVGETYAMGVEVTPADTNDVLLYKTSDASVATVYNDMLRAKSVGETTITVFSQSGSCEKTVKVIVKPETTEVACEGISTAGDSYELFVEDYTYLDAKITTADCDAYLRYHSSDDSVATVSSIGKIVATGVGEATITVTSSDGYSKDIPVTVAEPEKVYEITLALNVYYNDSKHNYYSNEVASETVTVTGNGQYTLSFDCDTDLSKNATAAGVDSLKNLTAIYIKDYAVTMGEASVSPLDTCNILYDEIKVNGVPMTITQNEPKSALKASGIFDTNDPINAWDGSYIEEVSTGGYVSNITGVDKPTTIEVTFTLSDMWFTGAPEPEPAVVPEATAPEESTADETGTSQETSVAESASESSSEAESVATSESNTESTATDSATTATDSDTDTSSNALPVLIVVAVLLLLTVAVTLTLKKKRSRN